MEKSTIEAVQRTWKDVEAIAPQAAALFYQKLFEADPSLRSMFKTDIEAQGKKLMQMIGVAVRGLRDLESLIPALEGLGRRHVGYGVRPSHYEVVGGALLGTLREGLGDAFTPEVERAWTEVYGSIAEVMLSASAEAVDPGARAGHDPARTAAASAP